MSWYKCNGVVLFSHESHYFVLKGFCCFSCLGGEGVWQIMTIASEGGVGSDKCQICWKRRQLKQNWLSMLSQTIKYLNIGPKLMKIPHIIMSKSVCYNKLLSVKAGSSKWRRMAKGGWAKWWRLLTKGGGRVRQIMTIDDDGNGDDNE